MKMIITLSKIRESHPQGVVTYNLTSEALVLFETEPVIQGLVAKVSLRS